MVSLVFIITPKVYEAGAGELEALNQRMENAAGLNLMNADMVPNPLLPPTDQRMTLPQGSILSPKGSPSTPATPAATTPKRNLLQRLFKRS
jgi:hypothetical protein